MWWQKNGDIIVVDLPMDEVMSIRKSIPQVIPESRPRDAAVIALGWTKLIPYKLPSLQYVINCSHGYDHLPLEDLRNCGVSMLNIPDYCSDEVSDYVVRIISQCMMTKPVVTVVGMGKVGKKVWDKLRDANYTVLTLHHNSSEDEIRLSLSSSSHVTLHMPLTKESHHWLNHRRVGYLSNAVVINTSRGKEVDTGALILGANHGAIKEAYLDVVHNERLIRGIENIKYTRHTSWKSVRSKQLRVQYVIGMIKEAVDGMDTNTG